MISHQKQGRVFWFVVRQAHVIMEFSENFNLESVHRSVYLGKDTGSNVFNLYTYNMFEPDSNVDNIFCSILTPFSRKTTVRSNTMKCEIKKDNYPIEEVITNYDAGLEIFVKGEEMVKEFIPEAKEEGLYKYISKIMELNTENIIHNLLPVIEKYKESKKDKIRDLLTLIGQHIYFQKVGQKKVLCKRG